VATVLDGADLKDMWRVCLAAHCQRGFLDWSSGQSIKNGMVIIIIANNYLRLLFDRHWASKGFFINYLTSSFQQSFFLIDIEYGLDIQINFFSFCTCFKIMKLRLKEHKWVTRGHPASVCGDLLFRARPLMSMDHCLPSVLCWPVPGDKVCQRAWMWLFHGQAWRVAHSMMTTMTVPASEGPASTGYSQNFVALLDI
jgi:hypothetical protein